MCFIYRRVFCNHLVHDKGLTMLRNFCLSILLMLSTCSACAGKRAEAQVCYAVADTDFWRVVETCKERGLLYEECPELVKAEAALRSAYGVCP